MALINHIQTSTSPYNQNNQLDTLEPMNGNGSLSNGLTSSPCLNRPDEKKPCALIKQPKNNDICSDCKFTTGKTIPPLNNELKQLLSEKKINFVNDGQNHRGVTCKSKCQWCGARCQKDLCGYHYLIVSSRIKTAKRNGSYTGDIKDYMWQVDNKRKRSKKV